MAERVLAVDDQTESRLRRFLHARKMKRIFGPAVCEMVDLRSLSVWVSKDQKWYSLKDATVDDLLDHHERSLCTTMLTGIFGLSDREAKNRVKRFLDAKSDEGVYTDGKGNYAIVVKLPDSGWDHHDTQLLGTAAAGMLMSSIFGVAGYMLGKEKKHPTGSRWHDKLQYKSKFPQGVPALSVAAADNQAPGGVDAVAEYDEPVIGNSDVETWFTSLDEMQKEVEYLKRENDIKKLRKQISDLKKQLESKPGKKLRTPKLQVLNDAEEKT
jgi:hypothetical protein